MKQLYTLWGESLEKDKVLNEYPRPQMVRESYLNLNGEWDYAISKNEFEKEYDGKILVPFSPEAALSGVNRFVEPDDYLIYHRNIVLPESFNRGKLILHFGAVDQEAKVYIDDRLAKEHLGGFTPFHVDITDYVEKNQFSLKVVVRDLTDISDRQTGKQRIKRGGIFYSPQSGIWQTVWMESVPNQYVKDLNITTDFDKSKVIIKIIPNIENSIQAASIRLLFKQTLILEKSFQSNTIELIIDDQKDWSPEAPNLYEFEISYGKDNVKGYFGMRKFERKADKSGIMRFYLNNKPYFLSGVLDQGYYPDGLLTCPSDDAMIFDIQSMKDLGFNLLRKHIKIEPLRWYYQCDLLGMIVWQDMVSGSSRKDIIFHGALALANIHLNDRWHCLYGRMNKESRLQFLRELEETLQLLKNITCISTWVPFNEAWGQFDSIKVEQYIRKIDSSRLIDHASGWSDQKVGDYHSRHIYFSKIKFKKKNASKRIIALTEFGGYSLMLIDHSFNPEKVFGYQKFETKVNLEEAIKNLYLNQIIPELSKGLNVLVYTQLSDVEDEVNGFLTYDRKVLKIDIELMKTIHSMISQKFLEVTKEYLE